MNRREFVGTALVGAGGFALPSRAVEQSRPMLVGLTDEEMVQLVLKHCHYGSHPHEDGITGVAVYGDELYSECHPSLCLLKSEWFDIPKLGLSLIRFIEHKGNGSKHWDDYAYRSFARFGERWVEIKA